MLVAEGGEPEAVVESRGLGAAGEDELAGIVERALADNPDVVEKLKADPAARRSGRSSAR